MKWTAALALIAGLAVPPSALAVGGPVPAAQGIAIGSAGTPYRYAAFGAGPNTVVRQLDAGPASVSEVRVSGHYGVPGVDFTGSTTGLSADGRTLVLAELAPNGPPRTTRLLVLDTPRLAVRNRLALPGWWTVDAISPDGHLLYLIHYPSNVGAYEVRAYDLLGRRLLAQPVVDPRDRGEAMTGIPVSRVMSPGGRWAYTLYARPSGPAFVHALDTVGRRAVCVDLPSLTNIDFGNTHLRLTAGGALLQVEAGGVTQTQISTRTFAVNAAPGAAPAPPSPLTHRRIVHRQPDATPWVLIILALAALAATLATLAWWRLDPGVRRRRGRLHDVAT